MKSILFLLLASGCACLAQNPYLIINSQCDPLSCEDEGVFYSSGSVSVDIYGQCGNNDAPEAHAAVVATNCSGDIILEAYADALYREELYDDVVGFIVVQGVNARASAYEAVFGPPYLVLYWHMWNMQDCWGGEIYDVQPVTAC